MMIVVAEDYLLEILQKRFEYLKNNPLYVKHILRLPEERLNSLVKFLSSNPVIPVMKGQPATTSSINNVICIFLGDEDEQLGGIADYEFGEANPVQASIKSRLTAYGTVNVPPSTTNILRVTHNPTGMILSPDEYEYDLSTYSIKIYNQSAREKDVFDVEFVHDLGEGERVQSTFDANYRIEVWSNNGDYLVELYGLLKWAVLSSRKWLGANANFLTHHIRGTDQQYKSDYFPNFAYKRSLTYTTVVEESAVYPQDEGGTPHYVETIEVHQREYRL